VLVAAIFFIPGLVAEIDPGILHPQSNFAKLTGLVTFLAVGLAFVLGVAGLATIAISRGQRTGYGFAVIGAVTPLFLIVGLICVPTFGGVRFTGYRMICGTNLAGIGKAMLVYANENDDELPLAGGQGTTWGPGLKDWTAANRSDAFGLAPDGTGGQGTISSSLYLLIKCGHVTPKVFVCGGERHTRLFDPNKYGPDRKGLAQVWDFGPNPARHCSYSYHMPYGPYKLTTSNEPGSAVAADRNPWIERPSRKAGDFSRFLWDGTVDQQRAGNASTHWCDGQNALFLDSHVEFAKRAFCGLNDDNIYTYRDGGPLQQGKPPVPFESQPANKADSLLVNDPPLNRR
jgi:hypothetical protein